MQVRVPLAPSEGVACKYGRYCKFVLGAPKLMRPRATIAPQHRQPNNTPENCKNDSQIVCTRHHGDHCRRVDARPGVLRVDLCCDGHRIARRTARCHVAQVGEASTVARITSALEASDDALRARGPRAAGGKGERRPALALDTHVRSPALPTCNSRGHNPGTSGPNQRGRRQCTVSSDRRCFGSGPCMRRPAAGWSRSRRRFHRDHSRRVGMGDRRVRRTQRSM